MSLRIPYDTVKDTVKAAFLNLGLSEEQAEVCSTIYTQSNADGVESRGLNRIPRFAEYVQKGWINLEGKPELMGAKGAVENCDGHLGIGIINALYCVDRAIGLAKVHGIGCVSLRNATHWMRGGAYAWRMAEAGFMGVSWINTESCMPLWGSDEPGVGNNPFCIAISGEDRPIVPDMVMSQYAYGKLGVYRLAGKELPFLGGFDKDSNLTNDPGAVEENKRILPTEYWKGSGMAIALDVVAALMASGNYGTDMNEVNNGSCTDCCRIFITFSPYLFGNKEDIQAMFNKRVTAVDASHPEREGGRVTCPGERTVITRAKSMADGVCVDEAIWVQVQSLTAGNMETGDIASRQ